MKKFKKNSFLKLALTLGLALGTVWHAPSTCSAAEEEITQIKITEFPVVVDLKYNPTSENAASGKAVADIIGDLSRVENMYISNRSNLADIPWAMDMPDDGIIATPNIPNPKDIISVINNIDQAIGDQSVFAQMNYIKEASSVALAACYLDDQIHTNEEAIQANKTALKNLSKDVGALQKNSNKNSAAIGDLQTEVASKASKEELKNVENDLNKRIDEIESGDIAPLKNKVDTLGDRINKVGANAAALAALHPMSVDDGDKLSVAVGGGTYRDKYASALGLFYRPSDRVMVSLAGSVGSGESMANVGLSFALDRNVNGMPSRKALNAEVKELKAQNAAQAEQIAMLIKRIEALEAKN